MDEDFLKIWFAMRVFKALPAAINSKLFLWALFVRFVVPCSSIVCGADTWCEVDISPPCIGDSTKVSQSMVAASGWGISTTDVLLSLA